MIAPTLSEALFWAMHDEAVEHLQTCPRNDEPDGLCCPVGTACIFTPEFWLLLEAASVASDMATAEHYAGRAPRGWWARQVPT